MVSRREFLTIGAGGVAAATVVPSVTAQTPKRGGMLTLRREGDLAESWQISVR